MGKVVTSQGLREFVSEGKFETVKNDSPPKTEAPPLEVKKDIVPADVKEVPKPDDYKDEDTETQAEIDKSERFKKLIGKKHYEMKKAQAEAESADRLAEEQFNRARLAEQKLAENDAELKELRSKAAPKEQPKTEKPDPAKFNDDKGQFKAFEYAEALAAWSADQSIAKYKADQEQALLKAQSEVAEKLAKERVAAAIKLHPDFEEVMKAADVKTHNAVLQYLTSSEHIGEVSYYLATHPEYVTRINALNPLKAIAEIGRLELTFEKPAPKVEIPTEIPAAPKVISGAPAPITPLPTGGSVDTNTDPAKMDFKQLRAFRRAQERAKHH
jgi:hypothetical protein